MLQNLYKQNIDKCERQEIRRKNLLQQQKLKRLKEHDGRRNSGKTRHHGGKEELGNKKSKHDNIENICLQFSEWFKEKPENLDDWILVPCPKGQRCFVVSENGKTKMFSKNKRYRMTFSSLLPGGGLFRSDNDYCILDCIYCQEKNTFYVLDALQFFIPLVDCDADFRFFWLKSKFSELDLEEKCKCENINKFKLLDNYDVSDDAHLAMALQKYPLWQDNQPKLDGFLFYHKKSHYAFGATPLVCWLFPFMLPDVLHMSVSKAYKPPINYCKQNPWQYMDEFDKEMTRKGNGKANENYSVLNITVVEDVATKKEHLNGSTDRNDNLLESLVRAEMEIC